MKNLLNILRCPVCKDKLKITSDNLTCNQCNAFYPIEEGIPNMMPEFLDKAIHVSVSNWENIYYDDLISKRNPKMLQSIDKPLIEYSKGNVLEVGCGNARLANILEKKGCTYIGIDPVYDMLNQGRFKGVNNLVRGVGEYLPFQDDSFDTIIGGYHSFKYIKLDNAYPECSRVLKKGGLLIFSLYNYWSICYSNILHNLLNRMKPWSGFPYRDPEGVSNDVLCVKKEKNQIENHGFELIKILGTKTAPFFRNSYESHSYLEGSLLSLVGKDIIFISRKTA